MPSLIYLTGNEYGRLKVVRRSNTTYPPYWLCICKCGVRKKIKGASLTSGAVRSCGCLNRELTKRRFTTHDACRTPEWNAWKNMKARCLRYSHPSFKDYGGRGITICRRWLESFENFREDMGPRPPGLTLERKNNNGNYTPSNCVWASRALQACNRRPYPKSRKSRLAYV